MDRRRNRRVTAFLSVRTWGVDVHGQPFTQLARVKNISGSGAVVQGMLHTMKAGELLHVQLGKQQAEFRVIWVGHPGSSRQGEVGIQTIPAEPNIWDVNIQQCNEIAGKG